MILLNKISRAIIQKQKRLSYLEIFHSSRGGNNLNSVLNIFKTTSVNKTSGAVASDSYWPHTRDLDVEEKSVHDNLESFMQDRDSTRQMHFGTEEGSLPPTGKAPPGSPSKKRLYSESVNSARNDVKQSPRGSKFAAAAERKIVESKDSLGSSHVQGSNRSNKVVLVSC